MPNPCTKDFETWGPYSGSFAESTWRGKGGSQALQNSSDFYLLESMSQTP